MLYAIRQLGKGFLCTLFFDDEFQTVEVSRGELFSYRRFQREVAIQLGQLYTCPGCNGVDGRDRWTEEVALAIGAAKECAV